MTHKRTLAGRQSQGRGGSEGRELSLFNMEERRQEAGGRACGQGRATHSKPLHTERPEFPSFLPRSLTSWALRTHR